MFVGFEKIENLETQFKILFEASNRVVGYLLVSSNWVSKVLTCSQ